MNIIIVGCGRVGAELAFRLQQKGHKVTIIDHVASAFANLDPDFHGRTIEGDPLNQDILIRAGIEEADGLATVTNHDSVNAVIAHIARTMYGIENVVARNYDPFYRPLLEAFEVQLVGSSSWGAQRIEELLYQTEAHVVFSAGNGEVSLYEFVVPDEWDQRPVQELMAGKPYVLAALTRAGQAIIPEAGSLLHKGDVLLVSGTPSGIQELRKQLYEQQEAA